MYLADAKGFSPVFFFFFFSCCYGWTELVSDEGAVVLIWQRWHLSTVIQIKKRQQQKNKLLIKPNGEYQRNPK